MTRGHDQIERNDTDPLLGYIYLIVSEEQHLGKIGFCTGHPSLRLVKLQTGNPAPLTLISYIFGDRHIEGAIHDELKNNRATGEWFRNTTLLGNVFACLKQDAMSDDDEEVAIDEAKARQAVRDGIEDYLLNSPF